MTQVRTLAEHDTPPNKGSAVVQAGLCCLRSYLPQMEKNLYKPSTMNDCDFVAFMRIAVASFILSE